MTWFASLFFSHKSQKFICNYSMSSVSGKIEAWASYTHTKKKEWSFPLSQHFCMISSELTMHYQRHNPYYNYHPYYNYQYTPYSSTTVKIQLPNRKGKGKWKSPWLKGAQYRRIGIYSTEKASTSRKNGSFLCKSENQC